MTNHVVQFDIIQSILQYTHSRLVRSSHNDREFVALLYYEQCWSWYDATADDNSSSTNEQAQHPRVTLTTDQIADALRVLKLDMGVVAADLRSSTSLSRDSKARGKAIQYEVFLSVMIERLESILRASREGQMTGDIDCFLLNDDETSCLVVKRDTSEIDNGVDLSVFPVWALDPLTQRVVTHIIKLTGPALSRG